MKGSSQCVCGSMPPGTTNLPVASITRALLGAASSLPTATILPFSHSTSVTSEKSWFTTRPFLINRGALIVSLIVSI